MRYSPKFPRKTIRDNAAKINNKYEVINDVNGRNPSNGSITTVELGNFGLKMDIKSIRIINDLRIIIFPLSSL